MGAFLLESEMDQKSIVWTRPSGTQIETNARQETIEYCESLGWKRDEPKKRGRKPMPRDENGEIIR